jgi:hypothetical protein
MLLLILLPTNLWDIENKVQSATRMSGGNASQDWSESVADCDIVQYYLMFQLRLYFCQVVNLNGRRDFQMKLQRCLLALAHFSLN